MSEVENENAAEKSASYTNQSASGPAQTDVRHPSKNRIVNYVMQDGTVRPLLIVEVWSEGMVNGVLFFDGANDAGNFPNEHVPEINGVKQLCTAWMTSVVHDWSLRAPGTWHWPGLLSEVAGSAGAGLHAVEVEAKQIAAIPPHVAFFIGQKVKNEAEALYDGVKSLLSEHLTTVKDLLDGHDKNVLSVIRGFKSDVPENPPHPTPEDSSPESASTASEGGDGGSEPDPKLEEDHSGTDATPSLVDLDSAAKEQQAKDETSAEPDNQGSAAGN